MAKRPNLERFKTRLCMALYWKPLLSPQYATTIRCTIITMLPSVKRSRLVVVGLLFRIGMSPSYWRSKPHHNIYVISLGPIEVGSLLFEGLTCIPPDSLGTDGCTQISLQNHQMNFTNILKGGYPVYVANVSTVADIQAVVNFARSANVHLIIKNTGHDFSGKSLGGGSLSTWTHVSVFLEPT